MNVIRNGLIGIVAAVCVVRTAGLAWHRAAHAANLPAAPESGPAVGEAEKPGHTIRLHLQKVFDVEGSRSLACTYLIPDGWRAQDRITWIPDDYMTPVMGTSTIISADNAEQIRTMSGLEVNFSRGPGGSSGREAPRSVSAFLLESWKAEHPGLDYRLVARQDTPIELPNRGVMPGGHSFAVRGMFKLQYSKGGVTYTLKTQARMDGYTTDAVPTAIGGVLYEGGWMISNLFEVRAPEDRLPHAMSVAAIICSSVRTDPHFFSRVMQARQLIQQNFYNMQTRIRQTSQIISQTNDELIASIDQSMAEGKKLQEHELTGFDDMIRGVDKYDDANGAIDLPSGYNHAFTDGNGHYLVTDIHGYDPNVNGPGGTWHELEKSH